MVGHAAPQVLLDVTGDVGQLHHLTRREAVLAQLCARLGSRPVIEQQLGAEDKRQADPVPPGARAILIPSLEVTPGSFTVHACFADEPVSAEPVAQALREAAERAKGEGRSPLDAVATPEDVVCAHQRIEVGR